jgi:hypothetical protein
MYDKGTIKVAWTTSGNYEELNSQMFNSLDEALSFTKGMKDFMIMRLIQNAGDSYKWEVLRYGDYSSYKAGMIISDNIILFTLSAAIIGYSMYVIIKKQTRK